MTIQRFYRTAACVFALLGAASLAVAGDIDVLVAQPISGSGATVVGAVDKGDGDVVASARVFEAELGGTTTLTNNSIWRATEPGFFTGDGLVTVDFPSGSEAAGVGKTISVFSRTFDIGGASSNLYFWDATDSDMSGTVDVDDVSFSPAVGATFALEDNNPLDGTVQTGNIFDEHPDFNIVDTDADMLTRATPGIYLVSLEAQLEGFDVSEPVYLVLATLDPALGPDEEAIEELIEPAVEWVQTNIVIPEPSAALLALLAATGLFAGRTRS